MIIDPSSIPAAAMYRFMISVIVPRPIAFISTVSLAGRTNLAPFSYFLPIASRPPLVGISFAPRAGEAKDTLRNLRETGDFVVNVVTESLWARMVNTAGDWPAEVSEFELTGLTATPSELVRAPRLAESPVHLECRLEREIAIGESTLVVGEIVRGFADDRLIVEGRIDPLKLDPIARLGGDAYATVRDVRHLARPKVERDVPRPPGPA